MISPAVEAIKYATDHNTVEGMEFLRLWLEGEFELCRKHWPDAPEYCYTHAYRILR